jgi:hypothetical protein
MKPVSYRDAMTETGGRVDNLGLARLTGGHAIPLACALAAQVARSAGVRALVIKGPVAEELGLRPPRASADIDLLVDPAGFDDLIEALARASWHERIHLWLFDRLEEHSMTLINEQWPVDIDVHRYFPGFLRPAEEVFEELWRSRQVFTIANKPVDGTNAVAGAAVVGLHALRWMHNDRNVTELAYLAGYLRRHPDVANELTELAARTGSSDTLSPLFELAGLTAIQGRPTPKAALTEWNRRTAHPSRTGEWFSYFQRLPKRAWPRELLQVLWPPRELYRQDHPDVADTRAALFTARVARLRNGADGIRKIAMDGFRRRIGR